MPLGDLQVSNPPQPVRPLHDAAEAVVGLQRVAAGRDEIHDLLEVLPDQVPIGPGGTDLVVQGQQIERLGDRAAHDVLGQHVQCADPRRVAVQLVLGDGLARRLALQHLEPVCRNEQGAGGLIQPVIGAADPLHHPGRALGAGQLDHQIHVTPVDA